MSRLLVARSCEPPDDECSGQCERQQGGQRPGEEQRHGRPPQHRDAGDRHGGGDKRGPGPAPAISTRLATDQIADGSSRPASGWPVTSETVSGAGNTAQTVHTPEATVQPQRAVAADVEDSRWLAAAPGMRREEETTRPRQPRRSRLPPHKRQTIGRHRAGIGQPGSRQRIRERQRAESRGDRTCEYCDPDEHRPHRVLRTLDATVVIRSAYGVAQR